jgi:proteasome-associated ATPase
LRPGRIDRKIKVSRPDEDAAREIFRIYLTPDLPIHPETLAANDGDVEKAVADLIDKACTSIYQKTEENKFLEVSLRSGRRDILYRGSLCSGAIIASIVQRAKESAIKRAISERGENIGICEKDLMEAAMAEYRENDIFPPTDSVEDWLKLLDYDSENVVKVAPIRPEKTLRKRAVTHVI